MSRIESTTLMSASSQAGDYARVEPRRGMRRWLRAAFAAALVVAIGGAVAWTGALRAFLSPRGAQLSYFTCTPTDLSLTLSESGEIKPVKSIDIHCELDSPQNTILFIVAESTAVKKGDLLVEFASDRITQEILTEEASLSRSTSDLEAARQELAIQLSQNASDVEKARTELEIARLDLKKYEDGDYPQKLNSVDLDIEQTTLEIERKQEELDKSRRLMDKGYITATKLRELDFELKRAQMTLEKHKLAKTILLQYEAPKERAQKQTAVTQAEQQFERVQKEAESKEKQALAKVANAEAQLNVTKSRLERLKSELAKCRITAPSDGTVRYADDDWRGDPIGPGKSVWKGQTLLKLPDTSQMMVATRIHESDRHKVEEGMPCLVTVPAVPGRTFSGKISKVAKYADSQRSWWNPELKEHATEIMLGESDPALSPGDTAQVKILVGDVSDVLAVPVVAVHSRGTRSFVFVRERDRPMPREVKIGRATTTMIEITDGLRSGDDVLMTPREDLLAMLPREDAGEKAPKPGEGRDARPARTASSGGTSGGGSGGAAKRGK